MAMNPQSAGQPAESRPGLSSVEWQVIERVPGDPWSAELMVWSGNEIDGLSVPLDENLLATIGDLRRRQADLAALDDPDLPAPGGATLGGAPLGPTGDATADRGRAGSFLQGLGRTTGSAQADRWLSGVPVRLQVIGGVALLVVFVLVMIIGSLTR